MCTRSRFRRRLLAAGVTVAAVLATLPGTAAAAPDPTRTPVTQLSADGRSATDGARTLTVSQASGLSPGGQSIRVTGSGYDPAKGIYVALCVIPPPNVMPTPCGGGVDIEGQAGASQWISSAPPSYGVGLATPYGPGGSFDTTFSLQAVVAPSVDCRSVRCAVLTRNDHTRSSDRSQDILIPVSFAVPGAAPPAAPAGAGRAAPGPAPTGGLPDRGIVAPDPAPVAPMPVPAIETTTTTTTPLPPTATLSNDRRSVTDGIRTLRVERSERLDPEGQRVSVTGEGFDPTRGVYLALCATPAEGTAPTCASGDADRSVWLSSTPPEWGTDLATPFEADGSFAVDLTLDPRIDDTTDCTEADCMVMVRSDDTAPADRSLDLALPVAFDGPDAGASGTGGTGTAVTDAEVAAAATPIDVAGDNSSLPLALGALALVAATLGGAAMLFIRRRSRSVS